jgi:hypothetical protein
MIRRCVIVLMLMLVIVIEAGMAMALSYVTMNDEARMTNDERSRSSSDETM